MEHTKDRVRARVRFDYKGIRKPSRFLLGSRDPVEVAEEQREQQAIMLQKIPIQGIHIENIDISTESFRVNDPVTGQEAAYAPAQIVVEADSVEDLARFTMKEEFRTIDILEPNEMLLSNKDMGRLLFSVNEGMKASVGSVLRRLDS